MPDITLPEPADGATTEPVATAPGSPAAPEPKKSLEESLGALDESTRAHVIEELRKKNSESANLRARLKEAEPKLAEYDRLAQASQTDAERAQAAQHAAEARAMKATERVVTAEIRAALTGLVDDPRSIIEDLNLSRFVDDDGDVDEAAVEALKAKYAAFAGRRAPRSDPTQASGSNGAAASSPGQELASILQGQLNRQ